MMCSFGVQALLSATCMMLATDASTLQALKSRSTTQLQGGVAPASSRALDLLAASFRQPSGAPWQAQGRSALATAAPQQVLGGGRPPFGTPEQQRVLNADLDASECSSQCSWECDSPKCDQICEPVCQPPRCETRCAGMNTTGCAIECEKPQCMVMCPQRFCPKKDCASCTTQCSEPMCSLKCHNLQQCRNECEQPDCVWNCKAPQECPAPKCRMVCESPKSCQGSTYKQLPPLLPGESAVQSFAAPSNIQSQTGLTMPVAIMSLEALPARRSAGLRSSSMLTTRRVQTTIIELPVVSQGAALNATHKSI